MGCYAKNIDAVYGIPLVKCLKRHKVFFNDDPSHEWLGYVYTFFVISIIDIEELHSKRARRERGLYLAEGEHLVGEALRDARKSIEAVIVAVDAADTKLVHDAEAAHLPVMKVAARMMRKLSTTETPQPIFVVMKHRSGTLDDVTKNKGPIVILDRVQDPGNIGTIIRTAEWFGATGVILGEECAELTNPKTVRSTMGSMFRLPIMEQAKLDEVLPFLRQKNYSVCSMVVRGGSRVPPRGTVAFLFGSEAHGVRQDLDAMATHHYTIHGGEGRTESLNVATSVAVTLALVSAPAQ